MLSQLFTKAPVFIRHVGINAVANILSKLQLFIVAVVLSRSFEIEEFASFGVLLTIVGLISVFASVGLGPAVIHFIAKEKDPIRRDQVASSALTVNSVLSVILTIGLYFCVPLVDSHLNYVSDSFAQALSLLCPAILLVLIAQLCIAFLNGVERFDLIAKSQLVTAFVALPLQLGLSISFGLVGFAIAYLLSNLLLLGVLLFFIVVKTALFQRYSFDLALCKQLLSFSFPSFISGIWPMPLMAYAFWKISAVDGAAFEAALLTSANQVFSILYFLPVMIAQVLMPKVASRSESHQQSAILIKLLAKLVPAMLAFTIFLILVSPLFPWVFDFSIGQTVAVFIVTILTVAIVSIQTQVDHFNVGRGKVWLHCGLNTFWGLVFLVAIENFYVWGAIGIVAARLLAYFIRCLAMVPIFMPLIRVKES